MSAKISQEQRKIQRLKWWQDRGVADPDALGPSKARTNRRVSSSRVGWGGARRGSGRPRRTRTLLELIEEAKRIASPRHLRTIQKLSDRNKYHSLSPEQRRAKIARACAYIKAQTVAAADEYIVRLLVKGTQINPKHVPKELIKLKRVQLQIKRKLKELRK